MSMSREERLAKIAQRRSFYVFCEDFITVLVGPFPDRAAAEQHVADHRYGDAHYEVISYIVAKHIMDDAEDVVTPEDDIESKHEHEAAMASCMDDEPIDWREQDDRAAAEERLDNLRWEF